MATGPWSIRKGARFFGADGEEVQREVKLTRLTGSAIGKGNFRHFMEKELHEHPAVIGDTLHRMVNPSTRAVALPALPFDFAALPRITISACGSAYYRRAWPAGGGSRQFARLPDRCRCRQRVPLSHIRRSRRAGLASWSSSPARPPIPWRHCDTCASRSSRALDPERAGEQHGARERTRCWRRWPDRRSASPSPRRSPCSYRCWHAWRSPSAARAARSTRRREAAMTAALLEVPAAAAEVLDCRPDQTAGATGRAGARRAVSRPRQLLPDRIGRRTEAEGDQLHPRRGLCRG